MKRHPVKAVSRAPKRVERGAVDVVPPPVHDTPFLSFHHTRMEIAAHDGRARVQATHTRFENGTLISERFAGEVDPAVYERLVASAQRLVIAQAASWFRAFSIFLPLPFASRDDRD